MSELQPASIVGNKTIVPVAPKGLTPEANQQIEQQVAALAAEVQKAVGDRELSRRVANFGAEAQTRSSEKIGLLRTKVGTLLQELDGESADIPATLVKLRETMDQINPYKLGQPGFWSRILGMVPGAGKILRKVAVKYETVQTQIDIIIGSLREGKDQLLQDNIELDQLYGQVQNAQTDVQKQAYFGELLYKRLQEALNQTTAADERERLETLMHKVVMRVQDLRTMEQVNTQFFVSIDMTINNNETLGDSVERTVVVTRSLLTVGLAIQAALANQKRSLKAVQETQKYAGSILTGNAAAIRRQTTEIGDLYRNPVLALDSMKTAYNDLMAAMDEADKIRREGITLARTGIAQLAEMSSGLDKEAKKLSAVRSLPEQNLIEGSQVSDPNS